MDKVKNFFQKNKPLAVVVIIIVISLTVGLAVGLTQDSSSQNSSNNLSQQEVEEALASGDFTIESGKKLTLTSNLTIPVGRTLTIEGEVDLATFEFIMNGTVVNQGTVTNEAATITVNSGALFRNFGTVNIDGDLIFVRSASEVPRSEIRAGSITVSTLTFKNDGPEDDMNVEIDFADESAFTPSVLNFNNLNFIAAEGFTGQINVTMTGDPGNKPDITASQNTSIRNGLTLTNVNYTTATLQPETGQDYNLTLTSSDVTVTTNSTMSAASQLTIDNDSTYELSGNVKSTFRNNVTNQGALVVSNSSGELELNSVDAALTFLNTGTISNQGSIYGLASTPSDTVTIKPSASPGSEYGQIWNTGTFRTLQLIDQEILNNGDGVIVAGTFNSGDTELENQKPITWNSTFEGEYKIKKIEPASTYTHVDLHFGVGTVTFDNSGPKGLPEGTPTDDVYPHLDNPGFIGCKYQQYDTVTNQPSGNAFTIQAVA